ncbi:nuclear transport factor 2 family protein [Frateuria aurantia]
MGGLDARITALLDVEAIRALRLLYSRCLDSGDIEGLDQVFTIDAELTVTVGTMKGLPAIKEALTEAFRLFDRDERGTYPFLHAITNHEVTLTGPDTAKGHCYLVDFETASKPDPNPLLLLGLYADSYRRTDGKWRITTSNLEVVWPAANVK